MKKYSSKADVALISPVLNEKFHNQHLIYPPVNKTSHFIKITRIKDKNKRAAAMQKAVKMYNIFENSREIKSALPFLYGFSIWLIDHKQDLSYRSIKRNINRAAILTEDQELYIWENLIYQIIEESSFVVKESLIQLIIANEFLKAFYDFNQEQKGSYEGVHFNEEQRSKFRAIANATVVITKELLYNEEKTSVVLLENEKKQYVAEQCILLQNRINAYKALVVELKKIKATYDSSYTNSFGKKLDQYSETITEITDQAFTVNEPMINAYSGEEIDAQIQIPSFSFEVKKPIQLQTILKKVKETSKEIIEKELMPVCSTILEGITLLRQVIMYYQRCMDVFRAKLA